MSAQRVYYAIGDVHGEAERLDRLYTLIRADIAARKAPACIVHLGDLVDRGPMSRQCVAMVMALQADPPEGVEVVALKGNHEAMFLNAYDSTDPRYRRHWEMNGGYVALASYEWANGPAQNWRDSVDAAHIAWLRALPTVLHVPERDLVFVHAGIDPAAFPACEEEIHLWTRSEKFFDRGRWPTRPETAGLLVVHGHTPTEDFKPYRGPHRINVDTGAVFGGPMTAVVLAPGEEPKFLQVPPGASSA
jgi:serine/threonine protein phosphatase 1